MIKIPFWSFLGLLLLVSGCQTPVAEENGGLSASVVEETPIISEKLISEQGIGQARLGMTVGELKEELGEGTEFIDQSFMVDFPAIYVIREGETLFYLVYGSWETLEDDDPITMIATDNPQFLTAEGVGVGTTIKEAEAIYGEATLNYNTDNESREYVEFADAPFSGSDFPRLSFRADREDGQFAGIYDEATEDGSYFETNEFHPDATISMIMIDGGHL